MYANVITGLREHDGPVPQPELGKHKQMDTLSPLSNFRLVSSSKTGSTSTSATAMPLVLLQMRVVTHLIVGHVLMDTHILNKRLPQSSPTAWPGFP